MTEEDKSGFLSFKGQMAARYKERMSMGFTLGTSFHGVHKSELNSTELHLAEGQAASQEAVTKAQDNRSDLLTKTRSKSSLGEHTPDMNHTATNNEATIFGGRSLTSTHITHSKHHEAGSSSMSGNELGSSSTGIKAALDHSLPASEVSSRRNLNSTVHTTSSGPNHTKTSEISLTIYKTAREQQNLKDHSNSLDTNNTEEHDKCQNKEGSFLTNTSKECAKLDSQSKVSEPSSDGIKDDNVRGIDLNTPSQFSNTGRETSSKDQNLSVSQNESLKTSSTIPPPLRINLRTHAARRKVDRDNLYVVHKKEPVKQTLVRRQVPRVVGSVVREKSGEVPRHILTRIKEQGDNSLKEGPETSGGGDRGLAVSPVSAMRQKFDVKNWRRQHFDKDDVKTSQEKRRSSVLERYLEFLKADNSPQPQLSSASMKKERWKASRPPTPHSTSSTRKESHTSSKVSLHNTNETTKCVTDLNVATSLNNLKDTLSEKQISHSDAPAELQSNAKPASKLSTKEQGKDSSIDDHVWNLPVSSSNSMISSSWGDKKVTSPSTRIRQQKLGQPSGKFSRLTKKSPATNGVGSGKLLSHVHGSMPEMSSTIQTSKTEDSSTKFKTFHFPIHRNTSTKPHEKEREKFSKPSAASAKSTSSNLPVQVDSTKHPSLKESLDVGGRKESTFHLEKNDKWPHILTNAAVADNKLTTDCLKDLQIHNLSGSLTALFSSSDDSDVCEVLPTNKHISPAVLNIIDFPASPEAATDKPALIDTLQTQYLARRKPVCADPDYKIRADSFSPRNTAQADCIKYLLTHRLMNIPTVSQGSFGTASPMEKMEIDSNMRATSPGNKKYSLLHGLSPQSTRPMTPRQPPAVVMTTSNAGLVQVAGKKWTSDGQPTQQEESAARSGDARQKQEENTPLSQPVNSNDKIEPRQASGKVDKTPSDSPIKKKRKVDKNKKVKKKKKKKKEDGGTEVTVNDGTHSVQKITKEKRIKKKKGNESTDIQKETIEVQKPDAHEQSEKLDQADKSDRVDKDVHKEPQESVLARRDYVKKSLVRKADKRETSDISKASGESYKSKRKDIEALSRSPSRVLHSQEGKSCGDSPGFSMRQEMVSVNSKVSFTPRLTETNKVSRLKFQPTDKFPIRSRIPQLHLLPVTPRKKLDRLIQYRRWREAMLDCSHPSKLPLTESFRQALDSAVMEEWSLHCWQLPREGSEEPQTTWWGHDYKMQVDILKAGFFGYGGLFSKEGFLELTARLPYVKVGPVRFIHVTYLLMAAAWMTVTHALIDIYTCSKGEYEYYCPDDDVECLLQWLAETD